MDANMGQTSEAFYFHNRFTNAKQPIDSDFTHSAISEIPATLISSATVATTEFDSAVQVGRGDSPHKLPSQSQKNEALEVLLKPDTSTRSHNYCSMAWT